MNSAAPDNGHYRIRIHDIFESAHYLYKYYKDGSDEELHGHTFEAELFIDSPELHNGISVDFLEIRKNFETLCKKLDHTLLNEIDPFSKQNPTAENLARFFYDELRQYVPAVARISEIRIWEGPQNHASFIPFYA